MSTQILAPAIILILWSLVMLAWLAITRLPTIAKLKLPPTAGERTSELAGQLPKEVQWKADNYNHLMEQPTIFYATVVITALIGAGDSLAVNLAWIYVALRIIHSIVHATVNVVLLRFTIFVLSTFVLMALAIKALLILF